MFFLRFYDCYSSFLWFFAGGWFFLGPVVCSGLNVSDLPTVPLPLSDYMLVLSVPYIVFCCSIIALFLRKRQLAQKQSASERGCVQDPDAHEP